MDLKIVILTFLIGGASVSAAAYFGSQSKSIIAALISQLPLISAVTLLSIYLSAGIQPSESYARSILLLAPALVVYFVALFLLLPHIGIIWSLVVGFTVFLSVSFITAKLVP